MQPCPGLAVAGTQCKNSSPLSRAGGLKRHGSGLDNKGLIFRSHRRVHSSSTQLENRPHTSPAGCGRQGHCEMQG